MKCEKLRKVGDSESMKRHLLITKAKDPWANKLLDLTRGGERTIAQIRANRCPLFREYQHKIHNKPPPMCDKCNVLEDMDHVLFKCKKWKEDRKLFLGDKVNLQTLMHSPKSIIEFLSGITISGYDPFV